MMGGILSSFLTPFSFIWIIHIATDKGSATWECGPRVPCTEPSGPLALRWCEPAPRRGAGAPASGKAAVMAAVRSQVTSRRSPPRQRSEVLGRDLT